MASSSDLERDSQKPETEHNEKDVYSKPGTTDEYDDGKNIPWTFTRIVAIASLCLVYVGKSVYTLTFIDYLLA